MWLYHSRLFILSHRWWANKIRVVLIIVSAQFHIWLVTIFLYRVQVQVPILPIEDIPSGDMIDALVAQHFNSCGLGGFLAPTGAQASPAFTNAQFTQPRQVSRALWGGGEVWHPCFVVRLAASNVFLVLTFSSLACSDPHAPPLPSSMLITPLSPPQQYADYVPHNGQRPGPGPGAVGFNYSCMVSTQPQGYAPAQPCYMTVTQPAPQVPVEQIPTTAHAHMNGTVYSEAGHVVYDDSVGETVGEHDEYITMTMSKLFNGECELEKMDEVDGLPSINSLLCEAAMWVVSGQRSLGKMESAARAEGSHGRGHPNWPVYRGLSLVCGDVTRRKGNNGPATGGLYTSASFLDSQPRPYGPRSILCQWTGVGPWGRSRRPASRYVILIVLYFILCTENFGDSLPLY